MSKTRRWIWTMPFSIASPILGISALGRLRMTCRPIGIILAEVDCWRGLRPVEFRLSESRQETMSSQGMRRRRNDREAGRSCAVRRRVLGTNGLPIDSAGRHLELLECAKRLANALAEEQKSFVPGARHSGDAVNRERWRTAFREIERSAKRYAIALENYRVAALSEFGRYKRRGASGP